MRTPRAFIVAMFAAAAIGIAPSMASAAPDDAAAQEAKRLYKAAYDDYLAGRCVDALPLLERAVKLVPSPNAGLLVARCLVVEHKRVLAATRYAEAEHDALELVRAGETRYADTAAAAAKEGADLRATLGTVRVDVAPSVGVAVAVEIDGAPAVLADDGTTRILHEPGSAKVTFVTATTRRQVVVTVIAGGEVAISAPNDERPVPEHAPVQEPPPAPARAPLPWTFWPAAGMTGVGLATFVVFGRLSESTYGDLSSRCGPGCGAADRADADRGRTFQTVANVGLVAGLVFATVAGIALVAR